MATTFTVRPLTGLAAKLRNQIKARLTPAAVARIVEPVFSKALLQRFDRFSSGGGDWKPLAASTLARKKTRRILFETGDFRKALDLGLRFTATWLGSVLRLEGRMKSTRTHKPSKLPVQKLLKIHQEGTSRIPARKVIVRLGADVTKKAVRAILALQRTRR